MSAYHTSSLIRHLAQRFSVLLILLTPVNRDSQPVASLAVRGAALGERAPHTTRNAVLHWNALASELMVDPGPVVDSRAFTILHLAIHDAVNGIERRFEPYTFTERVSKGTSVDAAVAAAAREVLITLSPSQREKIEHAYAAALTAIPAGPQRDMGVKLGQRSAQANLARRAGDGIPVEPWPVKSGPITQPVYAPTGKPGDYDFTPPFDQPPLGPVALYPGWGRLTPFGSDLSRHRLPGPDPLASEEYARDLNTLKTIGSLNSRTRTADQAEAAFFWFEFNPWHEIAREVLEQTHADVWQAARTLALTYLAVADAGIACFEAKYRFRYWRPYTAIRRADEDGNPATQADKDWRPLLWPSAEANTPFLIPPIPEYPSAAAIISAAAAEVLKSILGDKHSFEVGSPFLPGTTRSFGSLSQAAEENAMARVYGGIHFLRAVRDGATLGKGIGREVSRLLPPHPR